jgi:hypothetical protein
VEPVRHSFISHNVSIEWFKKFTAPRNRQNGVLMANSEPAGEQGYLAHQKTPKFLGPYRRPLRLGSWGSERGTCVNTCRAGVRNLRVCSHL